MNVSIPHIGNINIPFKAQDIMPSTKETIQVLTILCDEQLDKPGMLTRLEAFIDLLERKRRTSNNNR
jgi:hypothetical protein